MGDMKRKKGIAEEENRGKESIGNGEGKRRTRNESVGIGYKSKTKKGAACERTRNKEEGMNW
jgi:hypothetical protein